MLEIKNHVNPIEEHIENFYKENGLNKLKTNKSIFVFHTFELCEFQLCIHILYT